MKWSNVKALKTAAANAKASAAAAAGWANEKELAAAAAAYAAGQREGISNCLCKGST